MTVIEEAVKFLIDLARNSRDDRPARTAIRNYLLMCRGNRKEAAANLLQAFEDAKPPDTDMAHFIRERLRS